MSWLKKQFKKLKNRVTTSPWDRLRVSPYDRIRGDWTEGSGHRGTDFKAKQEALLNRNPSLVGGARRDLASITGMSPTSTWTPRQAGPGIQAIDPSQTSSYGNTRVGGTWSTPSSTSIEEQTALYDTPTSIVPQSSTYAQPFSLSNFSLAGKVNPVDTQQYEMVNGKMNPITPTDPTKPYSLSSGFTPSTPTGYSSSTSGGNIYSPGYQDVTAQTTMDANNQAFQWQDMNMDHVYNPGEEYDPRSSVWNGWMNQQDAVQNPTTPTTATTGYVPTTQAQQDFQNAGTMADWSGNPLTQEQINQYSSVATPKKTWKTERAAGNDWLGDIF